METPVAPQISLPTVDRTHGLLLLQQMLLIRRFEEKAAELYTKEKIRGFLHLCVGEEAVAVGVLQALQPEDYVLSSYREHGHALARGIAPEAIMAELYGRQEGCSGGRGGSMHLFDRSRNFYGGNSVVGGHLPLSAGMALAIKKQQKNNITCCFFGEGAVAEGAFHETMNLAALWQLPLLLVCENNLYAMGTPVGQELSVTQPEKKGPAYGIESTAAEGMNVLSVEKAAQEAAGKVRSTRKPFFLVCNTYRFRAHSMFDPELYREKSEVEAWKKKDPILQLEELLLQEGQITKSEIEELEKEVKETIQKAVDFAEAGTPEPLQQLTRFVYSNHK